MSMMLLEAASLQAPIICSDIPENQEAMQDKVLYFRSENTADLERKIQWALEHPGDMACMAQQTCRHVTDTLAWDKIVSQYDQLYRYAA